MVKNCMTVAGRILVPLLFLSLISVSWGQSPETSIEFHVTKENQRLEMVVNTSRILTLEHETPRAMVNNPDIVRVVPLSPNKVQVSALKTGVTQVNLWDEDGQLYSVSLVVIGDAQELQLLLQSEFPQASLRVRPLATSVVLSGRVDRSEDVSRIVRMAEDYYPKVVNNIQVGGVQQVLLHAQVMEVSRTKLRSLGFDWASFSGGGFVVQSVSGTLGAFSQSAQTATGAGGSKITFGLIGQDSSFFGFLEALRENNLAKVLAQPTLVTVSGRPASFNAGGEFPILVPQSFGTISIEYKQFGTRVDFVPIVLGNGSIRLEVRPQVSELDNANGTTFNGTRVPALRTRWVDTAVEMRAGQTLALAGLLQTRVESQNRGVPWLADLPWAGAAFRRVEERENEIELVITVRPELVDSLDPNEVPPCLPGLQTTSPNDVELYFRGYSEVPNCNPDRGCLPGGPQAGTGPASTETVIPMDQEVDPSQLVPPTPKSQASNTMKRNGSIRTARRTGPTENPPIAERQLHGNLSRAVDLKSEDPGLYGRVGYDVLDYKE